ncbi:CapA family protein [uncultured Roseivirga sp.]|uniref:CapA family protein n=1 Tax=uncultured Roseivirga sp. TaxID=543088 RepID=UPI0030D7CD8B|tara:strand:+ start:226880 stop:227992 length:1113 start_codon:yes stop_codon:yes gene_type:complete
MKPLFFITILLFPFGAIAQKTDTTETVSLLFIGDIMGHYAQIESALDTTTGTYSFDRMFRKVSPLIQKADFAIANLEVTLAGTPYSGYPRFSSPDELAVAAKKSGIDILLTANNHASDHNLKGIKRTINVLDSIEVRHTGTFLDKDHKDSSNLIIMEKGSIKVGLLNYTESTNGRRVPKPALVNLTDTTAMKSDIQDALSKNIDKLVVFLHWGIEYDSAPSKTQRKTAQFLFEQGVDIIIGAHPHVIQPMEFIQAANGNKERFIAYSLGNFLSDQRTRKRDGGAMVEITISKENGLSQITDYGYHLTWVNKPLIKKRRSYEVLICKEYEANNFKGLTEYSKNKMKRFIKDSRALLDSINVEVKEKVVVSN